jgi:hypothetical protein
MADETRQEADGRKRFRSPPYPQIPLSKAIERARELHHAVHRHSGGVSVVAGAWGIKETTGTLWTTAASLIQYGLVVDEGTGDKRKFQLTDAALRIILDADSGSEKRRAAVQRAAIAPMIHAELWERFGSASNVSDALLRGYLTLDRLEEGKAPYSETAADDVIRIYRDAISFSGLVDEQVVSSQGGATSDQHSSPRNPAVDAKEAVIDRSQFAGGSTPEPTNRVPTSGPVRLTESERELTSGLLSRGASFRLIVSGRVGARELERLIKKLELDKEILAEPEDNEPDAE